MTREDELLAERLRGRDVAALPAFLEAKRGALAAFIERQLGAALRRKVEPDDVFQEMSADAVRALPTADLTDRDPFNWLCQIAERRIIDFHRRFFGAQKRNAAREVPLGSPATDTQPGGLINLLIASMTTASQAFSRHEKEIRLLDALEKLPAEQRSALQMRYVEGLPTQTIAAALGKSDGAIRVMLSRSLDKLQKLLGVESGK